MGYFPFFIDITGQKGLIVGGGAVALRKAEKLLPFGPALTAAAPEFLPGFAALPGLTLVRGPFRPELLEGVSFVIAATDDREVNREISRLCRARNILVNAVDDREACTFLFPALVQRGPLTAGISTGGASPAAAAWVREQIEEIVPPGFDKILSFMENLRPALKGRPDDLKRIFAACLAAGRPLTAAEVRDILTGTGAKP